VGAPQQVHPTSRGENAHALPARHYSGQAFVPFQPGDHDMFNITMGLLLLVVMHLTQSATTRWADRIGYVLVGLNFMIGGASIAVDMMAKS
jgi:hypothetical protein